MFDWNEQRVTKLKADWEGGLSSGFIAKEMGITRNMVIGKVHRLQLEPRRLPPHQRPDIRSPLPKVRAMKKMPLQFKAPFVPQIKLMTENSSGVGLMVVEDNQCHYPLDRRGEDGLALYCGRPRAFGSYCEGHAQLCFNAQLQQRY